MSALPVSQPKTIDDLIALEAETGRRFELVNGELEEMSVSRDSSFVNAKFARFLDAYISAHGVGEVYDSEMIYELPKSARRADVSVKFPFRNIPEGDVSRFVGAPDVVVEVASPSDKWTEIRNKVQEWLDAGAQVVWLATPSAREVTIYRRGRRQLTEGEILDGEDVLPGFAVEVSRLFPSRDESRQEMARE